MSACHTLTKEMLPNPVFLHLDDVKDRRSAKLVADQKAFEVASDPMLLSWYDATTGRFSPQVACCSEEKPGWVVYAESRGGNIAIDINDQEYVFIYGDFAG